MIRSSLWETVELYFLWEKMLRRDPVSIVISAHAHVIDAHCDAEGFYDVGCFAAHEHLQWITDRMIASDYCEVKVPGMSDQWEYKCGKPVWAFCEDCGAAICAGHAYKNEGEIVRCGICWSLEAQQKAFAARKASEVTGG